jgi:uncharacterized membrane protein SpoIIM required for sporulation
MMGQATFEARHAPEWEAFESWLAARERLRRARAGVVPVGALPDDAVPAAYRALCQHLALARDRQYSPDLVDRLNHLVLRGHHALYGARSSGAAAAIEFFARGFPRLVRAEWRLVTAASLLFFGPMALVFLALQAYPDAVYYLLDPRQVTKMEAMYDPANQRIGMRDADDNVAMFAFYIWNNVKIGFQTFAGGLAFGLGTLFFLLFNGLNIGAVAAHLTNASFGEQFWSFVSGHSAMELTAIALSGAAGLRLGGAVIAPGRHSRRAALVAAARPAVRLMTGAAAMFAVAAFIEGFWSPLRLAAPSVKYGIGLALWALTIAYFVLAGRGDAR